MNEQNTWPDLWENSQILSESSLDSHAVEKLTHLWVNRETAIKLASLREDMDTEDTQILESEFSELWKVEQAEKLSQISDVLSEHRKHVSDVASFERSKLRQSLNVSSENPHTNIFWWELNAIRKSVWTIWNFSLDFIKWIWESLRHPSESVRYMKNKADWIISDEDLHYKIT